MNYFLIPTCNVVHTPSQESNNVAVQNIHAKTREVRFESNARKILLVSRANRRLGLATHVVLKHLLELQLTLTKRKKMK